MTAGLDMIVGLLMIYHRPRSDFVQPSHNTDEDTKAQINWLAEDTTEEGSGRVGNPGQVFWLLVTGFVDFTTQPLAAKHFHLNVMWWMLHIPEGLSLFKRNYTHTHTHTISYSLDWRRLCLLWVSPWLSSKKSACNAGDAGSVLEWGRPPGGGHGNPLWYSWLEIPWTEEPARL